MAADTTGAPCAIEAVFSSLDRGGRLLIFGVTRGDAAISLSPFRICNDEITIVGSMAVLNSFGAAIAHGAAARLAVRPRSVPRCPGPGPRRRVASYQASQRLPHAKIILYSDARHAFLFQHADDFGDEVLDFLR